MVSSNLTQWFVGGTRGRELRETEAAWDLAEALWRASPLNGLDPSRLAVELARECADRRDPEPAFPILVALAEAACDLLVDEETGEIEPDWSLIVEDVSVAASFRALVERRRRWASDYSRLSGVVRRRIITAMEAVLDALPPHCFGDWGDAGEALFEIPLCELLYDPSLTVEQLLLSPYDDDALRWDLLRRFRRSLERNLLVASGFLPDVDPREVHHKMIVPTRQKGKSTAELVDLYLSNTPFEAVMNLPAPFDIPEEARFEHCHIIGGTGHGKTQLMQRMIWADLMKACDDGRSVVVIDSQGDLINKISRLELFDRDKPNGLGDRLIVVDPSDVEYPAALNLFDARLDRLRDYRPVDRERVLNGVVELYETFFGDMLGAELTQKQGVIFKYLAQVMLVIPGATIHTLMQLMEDGKPFRKYMAELDGSARWFFEKEFFDPSFSATKKQILKRLWGVLSTPAFERMFAQPTNKLDLFRALNDGKIVLINTAKDLLKRDGSQLFGRFFVGLIAQAALERSVLHPSERTPTFVYVDEAQEYFDDAVEVILTQARKYRVGLTLAHQTLDQLSPRLRSALLSNATVKCVGGVSSKDARALADEMHTTTDFIEAMRRRGDRTEFAVWIKQHTPQAIRLSTPLGFLERQPTLTEEAYDALIATNRVRYCGTLDEARAAIPHWAAEAVPEATAATATAVAAVAPPSPVAIEPLVLAQLEVQPAPAEAIAEAETTTPPEPLLPVAEAASELEQPPEPPVQPRRPVEPREMGKGGPKHRYLQALVKELGEQKGFRATIEAPLPYGRGQVDVLLEQNDIAVAVEISVTTPADWERENLRKCLDAEYPHIALVLAKTRGQARYQEAVLRDFSSEERRRIAVLAPEEVLDYVASLAPQPKPDETVVKGYRVRVTHATIPPAEAKARRQALAKVIAGSLRRQGD